MMSRTLKRVLISIFGVGLVGMLILFGAACGASESAQEPEATVPVQTPDLPDNVVLSVKANSAPVLDGQPEALWNDARAISIQVSGGANSGSTEVSLKSVYAGDSVYFLVEWEDPTESLYRTPWEKQADGTSDADLARMTAWYECGSCHEKIHDRHKPGKPQYQARPIAAVQVSSDDSWTAFKPLASSCISKATL